MFLSGEVRKPKDRQRVMKVLTPAAEVFVEESNRSDIDLFVPIGDVPFHYIVIEGRYKNLLHSQDKFYTVRLITHSDNFDNLRIKMDWLIKNDNNFITMDSYITQDTFLIMGQDIDTSTVIARIDLDLINQ